MSVSCINAQTQNKVEQPMLKLSNGIEMPQFGIGTFMMPSNEECKDAVLTALRAGYRHIDTSHAYQDEQGVGEAVREFCAESGVPIWYKKAEIHDQKVKFAENTATVYSVIHLNSEVGGNAVRFPFIVSEVFVKENGKWKLTTLAFTRTLGE